MEFWNDQAIEESWNALIELAKKYRFVLIGGWACYLYTEIVLILKQQAELERKDSVKRQKDRVDILNILIKGDVDMRTYLLFVRKYGLEVYMRRLETIIRTSMAEFEYLAITNPREIKLIKKKLIEDFTSAKTEVFA